MEDSDGIVESLAQLTLFADLTHAQLEEVAHTFEEEVFAEGQRVLRTGLSGAGFYLIQEGEATILIEGDEQRTMSRGDFFGEISAMTGDPPSADVVAKTMLRCLVLPGPELESFLLEHPPVMLRMLKAEARRLRTANRWRG